MKDLTRRTVLSFYSMTNFQSSIVTTVSDKRLTLALDVPPNVGSHDVQLED